MTSNRFLISLIVLFVGASFCQAEDEPTKVKFVAPGQVLNIPKTVPTISPDGLVVTHLLEDVDVAVGGQRQPEAASVCASIRSTLGTHDKPVHVTQVLRGHIDIQPGVEAAVIFQSCGKTTLIPLPKSGQGDIEEKIDGVVPVGPDYLATICLIVQRSSRVQSVQGVLSLESLEITITDPEAKTKSDK